MLDYEWDLQKASANFQKHSIAFADAITIFSDDWLITQEDDVHISEQRYVAIGRDAQGRVLVVVFTYRGLAIRIISARKATLRERRYYEEEK